jgi:coenzyme F420-reducing hydrogenase gamma subunit
VRKKMKTFAVLQLSGCAGCEVSLLDADALLPDDLLMTGPTNTRVMDIRFVLLR